jgi:hypothetical protein
MNSKYDSFGLSLFIEKLMAMWVVIS